jgi:hypothetical protein
MRLILTEMDFGKFSRQKAGGIPGCKNDQS